MIFPIYADETHAVFHYFDSLEISTTYCIYEIMIPTITKNIYIHKKLNPLGNAFIKGEVVSPYIRRRMILPFFYT